MSPKFYVNKIQIENIETKKYVDDRMIRREIWFTIRRGIHHIQS